MDLLYRKCTPIDPATAPLTRRQVADLIKEVPDWKLEDGHLYRRFTFRDFRESIRFVNGVVTLALEEGHVPDICIHQARHVDVLLYSYAIGGLSCNDFILAVKIVHRLIHHPAQSGR